MPVLWRPEILALSTKILTCQPKYIVRCSSQNCDPVVRLSLSTVIWVISILPFVTFTATGPITVWRKMAYHETHSPEITAAGTSHQSRVAGLILVWHKS